MAHSGMTSRERLLAATNLAPVDRLPFWPKLDGAYFARYGERMGARSISDFHRILGTDEHVMAGGGYRLECPAGISLDTRETPSERVMTYTVHGHSMVERHVWDGPSCSWVPVQHPVETREDILRMTQFYEAARVVPDQEAIDRCHARFAQSPNALSGWVVGESPLMYFVEWTAGIAEAHFLLTDHQDEVEALFAAHQRLLLDTARFGIGHMRADLYYFIENTSTTLISPDQYARYCAPHIDEYGALFSAADKKLALHMCGHLRLLLPQLARSPAAAFEAFTSPTVGNVTMKDGRLALPGKCLMGGTNATTWLKPLPGVIAELEQALDGLDPRGVILSSGGVMPPDCDPSVISGAVGWLNEHASY